MRSLHAVLSRRSTKSDGSEARPGLRRRIDACGRAGARTDEGMKILFLADGFLPQAGGSRVYYYNLYRNLVSQSADQVVILTKRVPGWREFDSSEAIRSLRIVRRFRPLCDMRYQRWPR